MRPHSLNEARILAHVLGVKDYQSLLINPPSLSPDTLELFNTYNSLYKNGYPLEYITKQASFLGGVYNVDEGILLPRPETEQWVVLFEQKIKKNLSVYSEMVLIDVGCGSGCIGLHLSQYFSHTLLLDLYSKPLEISNINKDSKFPHSDSIQILHSDLVSILSDMPHTQSDQKTVFNFHFTFPTVQTKQYKGYNILPIQIDYTKYQNYVTKLNNHIKIPHHMREKIHNGQYCIVANLPYVPESDISDKQKNNVLYEPNEALYSPQFGMHHTYRLLSQIKHLPSPYEVHIELDQRQIGLFT